jgi:acyl-CoA reductase-like NAD-dependent aldehyde dehydrogenase
MERIEVLKTYKLYIGGQFPRTESGRYYPLLNSKKQTIANISLASRKDFRNAVVAARTAFNGWSSKTAFNRGQILYRIAEMLEGRKMQFVDELVTQGVSKNNALKEVQLSIDRMVYYSGWCDKFQQCFSAVNPVSSSHFNFSVPEPMGVVAAINGNSSSLLNLISTIAPVIAGGNTLVILASEKYPLCAVTFAEVLATSDLPGGVVNILTGKSSEIHSHMASHMDVNAIVYSSENKTEFKTISELAAMNVKRVYLRKENKLESSENENPYFIMDFQEIKTTWHPIERVGGGAGGY